MLYLLTLETKNFSFAAIGTTRAEAMQGLLSAWREHRRQYPTIKIPATEQALEEAFSFNERAMHVGVGYRDGEALAQPT